MEQQQRIIPVKGKLWQHGLLKKIAHSREFPTRLRLFNLLKKCFGLEVLLTETPSGLKLMLDISDWVQYQIYFFGNYEPVTVALFKKLAEDATVVFDIGAHIGQYALECAADDGGEGRLIYAIEANPKTFTYLLNNIQLNELSQVKPVLGALAAGTAIVNMAVPQYWNLGNTQISTDVTGPNNYLMPSFSIITLLEYFKLKHIDLIKIDIEGQELTVLESLFAASIYPSNILFEFIPEAFSQAERVLSLLKKEGYVIKDIIGRPYTGKGDLPEQNLWASTT